MLPSAVEYISKLTNYRYFSVTVILISLLHTRMYEEFAIVRARTHARTQNQFPILPLGLGHRFAIWHPFSTKVTIDFKSGDELFRPHGVSDVFVIIG